MAGQKHEKDIKSIQLQLKEFQNIQTQKHEEMTRQITSLSTQVAEMTKQFTVLSSQMQSESTQAKAEREDLSCQVGSLLEMVKVQSTNLQPFLQNQNSPVKYDVLGLGGTVKACQEGKIMGRRRKSRGGGNERKILVRSQNNKEDKIQWENEVGNVSEESYKREEFHIVDLNLNKIYRHCLPSLPRASGVGNMVASGHSIFIFGGLLTICERSPLFKFVKNHPESHSHFYMGASRLHFDPADLKDGSMGSGGWEWRPAPPMNTRHSYTLTCLNGDVYSFGNNCFAPEVFHVDTTNSEDYVPWKSLVPLPRELVDCTPCGPVIPDPTKNRILVHFRGGQLPSPSLYAFSPPTRQNQDGDTAKWECLDSNFRGWNQVVDAALLDGVLYLYGRKFRNLVSAYEVATRKWLDVQWSTRVIEKDFSVDDCCFEFDSLFCLDDTNKILCLAVYSPIVLPSSVEGGDHNSPSKTTLLFFKIRAERCGSTISLTPFHTRSYEIESTTEVLNFLPL